jgi:two-component system NtrC family sensor kinase
MSETLTPSPPSTRWGLKTKLILSMLFVGVVPLVVGLGMAFWQGSQEIREVSGESFAALATEAARKLDLLVSGEVARTSRIATDPIIVRQLERRRDSLHAIPQADRQAAIERNTALWEAKDPAFVKTITDNPLSRLLREYHAGSHSEAEQLLPAVVRAATKMLFLTDVDGTLVAAMTTKPAYSHGMEAWWQGAFHKGVGQLYIEDVHFDRAADSYVFTISMPVMDSLRYEVVGVLHRVIDAKEFFSPSTHPIRFGKTGHVMLIDSRGIVMSCPILPTGVTLSDTSLVSLVAKPQPGWVTASSDGHGGTSTSIIGFAPLTETSRATNGSIEGGSWHTFVWQSSDELFGPIRHLFTWMTAFGLIAVGLLVTLGFLAASRIVTPVKQLQAAARSIGRGDLRAPIQIQTGDELEDLAQEFNRMNKQLEAAFAGLTDQVNLKTQEVQYLQQSTDQILDTVPTPILLIDGQEVVQYVNRAARETFDIRPEQLTVTPLFSLLPVDAAAQRKLRQEFHDTGAGASSLDDARRSTLPCDPLAQTAPPSSPAHRSELQIGSRVYHYQWFRLPGWSGEHGRIGLVLRDVTEESRLQDQLIQAEKTGSLGVLTAGIGHELNNPLFGIVGLGEAIQEEADLQRVKSYARDIVAQGHRMAAIIRDFTGVTARESLDKRIPVCIEEQLDHALASVQTAIDMKGIVVEKSYAGNTRVLALPDQLLQALSNLLMNAVQAMKGVGTLRLSTSVSGHIATATVADSGPGISKQHLSKVFDPFFTTKGQGEGSGLGLTVARRILRKFGGDIRIESLEGQGATCIVTLPILTKPTEEGPWTASASHAEPQPSRSS